MSKDYEILTYKKNLLVHNLNFPLELSHSVVDGWIEKSACEDLAEQLKGVNKRCFVESVKINAGDYSFRAKFYRTVNLKRKFEALFVRVESIRNFRTAIRVVKAGIRTAEPLCVWGSWRFGIHQWSVMFSKDIGALIPLPEYLDSLNPADGAKKKAVSLKLAGELAKLHEARVYVYDPAKNVLVKEESGDIEFYFIDFDTVRFFLPLTKKQVTRVLCHCIRPPKHPDMFTHEEIKNYALEYLKARKLEHWLEDILPHL